MHVNKRSRSAMPNIMKIEMNVNFTGVLLIYFFLIHKGLTLKVLSLN